MSSPLNLKTHLMMELLERFDDRSIGRRDDPWATIEEIQIYDNNITLITTKGIARILVDVRE